MRMRPAEITAEVGPRHPRTGRLRSSLLKLRSDRRLLARWQAGDSRAAAALVHRYRRQLCALCSTVTGQQVDDEDALADLASAVPTEAASTNASVALWLYRAVRDRSLERLRVAPLGQASSGTVVPAEVSVTPRRIQLVQESFDGLSESQRTALLLRLGCTLSYEQIAWVMRTDASEVKSLLVQARCRLALAEQTRSLTELLEELGAPATPWLKRANGWLIR